MKQVVYGVSNGHTVLRAAQHLSPSEEVVACSRFRLRMNNVEGGRCCCTRALAGRHARQKQPI